MTSGILFLIPVPLGDEVSTEQWAPKHLAATCRIQHFVAENAKTARAHLKLFGHPTPMRELAISEIGKDSPDSVLTDALATLRGGHDVGLMSEAGCPAVADPGSRLVALAHTAGITVRPLIGPSSLLLALMGSGLNGQRFSFHGYLPIKDAQRSAAIRKLESDSHRDGCVQLFIETPYRNNSMYQSLVNNCAETTRLCLASDLTLPSETIRTATIAQWRSVPAPDLDRRPTVFLIQAD